MIGATQLAHLLMRQTVAVGDTVVDATAGNGHDTVFLAELVGRGGRVFALDVQKAALAATSRRVGAAPQVTLVHAGHETLGQTLSANLPADGQLAGVMFNLGYLPGAPKTITTTTETTRAGLEQAMARLKLGGLVTLVLYPGHPGGAEETAATRSFARKLTGEFAVTQFARINASAPAPELLVIERVAPVKVS